MVEQAVARPRCGSGRLNWRARPTCVRTGEDIHHVSGQVQRMVHAEIAKDNDRIRWIENNKLPARLELKDLFHAFESEETVQK